MSCPYRESCRRYHYTLAIQAGVYDDRENPPTVFDLVSEGIIAADQIAYSIDVRGNKKFKSLYCKILPVPENQNSWCPDFLGKDYPVLCREYRTEELKKEKRLRREGRQPDRRPRRDRLSPQLRRLVWEKSANSCWYCKRDYHIIKLLAQAKGFKTSMVLDHLIPKSLGGEDLLENLVLACWECNGAKSNREIWREGERVGFYDR